ncbi:DUF4190 domain-containing protein [Micromonospora sp. NPDC005205]|uniref:DUF4190 domain-containing protein n=1 Tax=Micromonospora sp. NPDC005205 TaxID=3156714 RepID=UPI0033A1461A
MTQQPHSPAPSAPALTTQGRTNPTALSAAVFAALSVVFLPLAWLLGAAAVLTARRARAEITRTGDRGESLATIALTTGWATIAIVTVIYSGVLLSAVF